METAISERLSSIEIHDMIQENNLNNLLEKFRNDIEKFSRLNKLYGNILNCLPVAIALMNLHGSVRSANNAFLELTAYESNNHVSQNIFEIEGLADIIGECKKSVSLVLAGKTIEGDKYTKLKGELKWIHFSCWIVENDYENDLMLLVLQDTTHQNRKVVEI